MSKELLIVFVKNIVLGKVKTRLAKSIGNTGAFNVYKQLFNITQTATLKLDVERHIYFSDVVINASWPNDQKFIQKGNDIGERMESAFKKGFEMGFDKIILIGSDLPDISPIIISEGFNKLSLSDTVFGPATDGGYYLVGMKKLPLGLFRDKPWSHPSLMNETLKTLVQQKISHSLLTQLNDIDTIEDLNTSSLKSEYKNT